MSFPSVTKTSLAAALVLALGPVSALAADPTPAGIAYAKTIFIDVGMKPSLDHLVPVMLGQLENEVVTTNPQLKAPVSQAVLAVTPEFVASEESLFNDAATFLATQMTEQELKETAAFYETPTGKKFVVAQNAAAQQIAGMVSAWRQTVSSTMMTRVREEMKKKGYSF
jgi:hypothetical protein